jgi:hypothetical protein
MFGPGETEPSWFRRREGAAGVIDGRRLAWDASVAGRREVETVAEQGEDYAVGDVF